MNHDDAPRSRKRKKTAPPPAQQGDLFFHVPDLRDVARGAAEGKERSKEAQARADQNASAIFKAQADAHLRVLCERMEIIGADDFWLTSAGAIDTHEHRALGPVFTRAITAGIIVKLDQRRPSKRPEQHGYGVELYRSTLYKP